MRKFLMGFVVGGVALLSSVVASAGPFDLDTTINDWAAAGTLVVGDKEFTLVDTDLDGAIEVSITTFSAGPNDFYTVQISGFASGVVSNFIEYDIAVTDPTKWISSVELDTTHAGSGVEVVKEISGDASDTLTSTDGSTDSTGAIVATNLSIYETFSSGAGGSLVNSTNTITQSTVPEPSTFVLAGLAAIGGLVYSRRRKV